MSVQPALPMFGQQQPRAHKRQRATARAVYALDRERLEGRQGQILRILAAHWNAKQVSPTALELLTWALAQGESLFDVNSLRPRLHELCERGLVTAGEKRRCAISGKVVHVWRVREIGSEPR